VRLQADACPLWAEIAKTSGDAEIDAAALRYALEGARYYPSRQDGNPVDGTVEIIVDFSDADIDYPRAPW
jgi:outer membrane biosynthesis protein TonB